MYLTALLEVFPPHRGDGDMEWSRANLFDIMSLLVKLL